MFHLHTFVHKIDGAIIICHGSDNILFRVVPYQAFDINFTMRV
jgi:hypothetical protein